MCVTPAGKIGNWTCGMPKSLPHSRLKITPSFSLQTGSNRLISLPFLSMSTPKGSGVLNLELRLSEASRPNRNHNVFWGFSGPRRKLGTPNRKRAYFRTSRKYSKLFRMRQSDADSQMSFLLPPAPPTCNTYRRNDRADPTAPELRPRRCWRSFRFDERENKVR